MQECARSLLERQAVYKAGIMFHKHTFVKYHQGYIVHAYEAVTEGVI